ncbi:MAG TPA: tetratricopeptide repeat protein [Gaiellaceae bacterium]|nr:tetratricopeptide repeat protein [Gaiellaceae bacterium]
MPRGVGRHIDDQAAVGVRLRAARLRAGLSQRELAFDGCSYAYISRIEAGQRIPSMQVLQEFGRRLGVSATYLAVGTDTPDHVDPLDDGDLACRLGDNRRAEQVYEAVTRESAPSPVRLARALAGQAEIAFQRGDVEEAARLFEAALAEPALGRERKSAIADRLGRIYALRGEHERALGLYEKELVEATKLNDVAALMRFSTLLANAVLDAGNTGRAQELLGQALAVADQVQDPLERARLWWSQSRLHDSQGQPELAAHYARLALSVLEEHEQTGFAAVAHLLLAYIENERGDGEAALACLERAELVLATSSSRLHWGLFQVERARALLLTGERQEAASVAMGALPLVADASATDSGRAQALLGDVFRELGDVERAQELYELAVETLPGIDRNLLRVYEGLAEILEEQGRGDEALDLLKQAMHLRREAFAQP